MGDVGYKLTALRFKLTLTAAVLGKLLRHTVYGRTYRFKLVAAFFLYGDTFALLGYFSDTLTDVVYIRRFVFGEQSEKYDERAYACGENNAQRCHCNKQFLCRVVCIVRAYRKSFKNYVHQIHYEQCTDKGNDRCHCIKVAELSELSADKMLFKQHEQDERSYAPGDQYQQTDRSVFGNRLRNGQFDAQKQQSCRTAEYQSADDIDKADAAHLLPELFHILYPLPHTVLM